MVTQVDSRKLYVQVADSITASIKSGEYPPGARLASERDLAVAFKVSRTTIREAMIALEIRDLVEARPGSGIYVSDHPPTQARADDLDIGAFELIEARRLFEGEAAALAAAMITDEQLREIEAILAEMVNENARKQNEELADRSFHMAIARATCNSAIILVVETLWDMRYKSPLCADMLERARRAGLKPRVGEHRKIFLALRQHNPKAARRAMRDHLRRVIDAILAATETDAVDRARKKAVSKRNEYTRRLSV
jgi:GntR family transcriptional regulator, hexuronate regulon transcriptional repressor